jgi:Domain of unknown function (DUF4262)
MLSKEIEPSLPWDKPEQASAGARWRTTSTPHSAHASMRGTHMNLEAEWEQIGEQLRQKIAAAGQAVQVVHLTEEDPPGAQPFMYTIGNHQFQLPELLLVGTADVAFVDVLNRLGKIQRDRRTGFADEERVNIGGRFPLRIVDAGEIGRAEYATFVGIYYATQDYEVRQVLLPDTQGRWPDMPSCDLPYADQPILSKINRAKH